MDIAVDGEFDIRSRDHFFLGEIVPSNGSSGRILPCFALSFLSLEIILEIGFYPIAPDTIVIHKTNQLGSERLLRIKTRRVRLQYDEAADSRIFTQESFLNRLLLILQFRVDIILGRKVHPLKNLHVPDRSFLYEKIHRFLRHIQDALKLC